MVENVAVQHLALKGQECYIKWKLTFRFQQFHQPVAVL
jgi:hypothetical protein